MTERQQNENWERLTPDFRKEIKRMFSLKVYNDFSSGYNQALILLFGKHNLTSDIEQEEMLIVSVPKAAERIRYLKGHPKEYSVNEANSRASELISFLGDKCFTEKETLFSEKQQNENKENVVVCRENIMYFGCPAKICNGFRHNILKDGDIVTVISYNRDKDTYDVVLNSIIGETIPAKNLEPYTEETNDETMQDFEQETRSKVEESRKEYIKSQAEREAKTMFDRQLLEEIYVMLKTKL